MIIDHLKNCDRYAAMHEGFARGFAFIKRALKENLEAGKYELDGDRLYAFVQAYHTNDQGTNLAEAHKEYIDIQCILSGVEVMETLDAARLALNKKIEGQDACLYEDSDKLSKIVFQEGDFAIYYPGEGHKPGVAFGTSAPLRKVVVKVKA